MLSLRPRGRGIPRWGHCRNPLLPTLALADVTGPAGVIDGDTIEIVGGRSEVGRDHDHADADEREHGSGDQ